MLHSLADLPTNSIPDATTSATTTKLELWLQYKGETASQLVRTKPENQDAIKQQFLDIFTTDLKALRLDLVAPQSTNIIWLSGQIRCWWLLDVPSQIHDRMFDRFTTAMTLASSTDNTPMTLSQITFREDGKVLAAITPKAPAAVLAETSNAEKLKKTTETILTSKDVVPAVSQLPQIPAKRKRLDDVSPLDPLPKRVNNTEAPPTMNNTRRRSSTSSMSWTSLAFTPMDSESSPMQVSVTTRSDVPLESYLVPTLSFQQYQLDLADVSHEIVRMLHATLSQNRRELAQAKKARVQLEVALAEERRKSSAEIGNSASADDNALKQQVEDLTLKLSKETAAREALQQEKTRWVQEKQKLTIKLANETKVCEAVQSEKTRLTQERQSLISKLANEKRLREEAQQEQTLLVQERQRLASTLSEGWKAREELQREKENWAEERKELKRLVALRNECVTSHVDQERLLDQLACKQRLESDTRREIETLRVSLAVANADKERCSSSAEAYKEELGVLQQALSSERQALARESEINTQAEVALEKGRRDLAHEREMRSQAETASQEERQVLARDCEKRIQAAEAALTTERDTLALERETRIQAEEALKRERGTKIQAEAALRKERQDLAQECERRIQAAEEALQNERRERLLAEQKSASLKGISPGTIPSMMEALIRMAQLTDKVMSEDGR